MNEIQTILSTFSRLQPAEQKIVIDAILNEFRNTPMECSFCGGKR